MNSMAGFFMAKNYIICPHLLILHTTNFPCEILIFRTINLEPKFSFSICILHMYININNQCGLFLLGKTWKTIVFKTMCCMEKFSQFWCILDSIAFNAKVLTASSFFRLFVFIFDKNIGFDLFIIGYRFLSENFSSFICKNFSIKKKQNARK